MRKLLLSPLCLLSFFYGWANSARVYLYERGIFPTRSLAGKVVSVGNITLGGTGKTPFVVLLAEMLKSKGLRVAILSRGYKGNFSEPFRVVSDGKQTFMDASQAGDEPYLMSTKLSGIPVIVGQNRWRSGKYAIEHFQSETLILDDGFQHLPLKRDLNLLLVDSSAPFGNGYLFPRGILRESLSQLRRADAIILTKAGQHDNFKILKLNLTKFSEEIPIFKVEYAPGEIRMFGKETSFPAEYLKGKKVLAFSGIAKPISFKQTLLNLNADIAEFVIFPDHHQYRPKEWEKLSQKARDLGVEAMVTTEKDLVRCQGFKQGIIPLWGVSIRHVFLGNDLPRFEEFLFSRLSLVR
ncbi:MAG: tetraacyldisaccharide 4'-kinase [Thermodesulfobacteriota bacterium]|nr:tetraacyldisaccharide 4'-kinase [Thermodesulfobacteriota bacterium]